MKKLLLSFFSIILLFSLLTTMLVSCNEPAPEPAPEQPKEPQVINIPDVKVDLKAPENRVEVSESEPSEVTDASGKKLSGEEWILNSKFSKEYIQRLGEGEYTFTYKSETQTGTIKLIITDSERPNYLFTATIPSVLEYRDSIELPQLVKDQDSYQGDYEVNYELKLGETEVEVLDEDGKMSVEALDPGNYTFTAWLDRNGTKYTYEQSFYVKTFEEYLKSKENVFFYNEQTSENIAINENGYYTVDTHANTYMHMYTVSQEVIEKAKLDGKTKVIFTIVTDRMYSEKAEDPASVGNFWMTDSWKDFYADLSMPSEGVVDNTKHPDCPHIKSLRIENGKYIYEGTVFLNIGFFSKEKPLQLWFTNGAKVSAEIGIRFE